MEAASSQVMVKWVQMSESNEDFSIQYLTLLCLDLNLPVLVATRGGAIEGLKRWWTSVICGNLTEAGSIF